ncbi:hypothetical protein ACWEQ0_15175 [Nocardia thailandica]
MSGSHSGWARQARAVRRFFGSGGAEAERPRATDPRDALRDLTGPADLIELWSRLDAPDHRARSATAGADRPPAAPTQPTPSWPDTLTVSTLTWMAFLGG